MSFFKGVIGEVVETGRSLVGFSSIEWRIPDFHSLAAEGGNSYESPIFDDCDGRWCLKIFPNGFWRDAPSDWVSLYFFRAVSGPPKTLDVMLGIRGAEGVENKRGRRQEFSEHDDACSWNKFCLISKLREQKSGLMPGNVLIFSLDMKSVVPRGGEKALQDFGTLLASGENSDVTVQVSDVEFKIHSLILSARSPALSVSLRHESKEKTSNKILIEDTEPEAFREYLQYLYTGSVRSLTEQNVFNIYRLADKYLADDLKLLCLNHIRKSLSVRAFCDTVKLALTHGESDLLERALDFAKGNIQLIIVSVEWQNFICEHPREANEILVKCFGPRS